VIAATGWQLAHEIYPASIPSIPATIAFLYGEGLAAIAWNTMLTLARSFTGFILAFVASTALGLAYTSSRLARSVIRAFNTIIQSVSVLVWVVVLVMLFGVLSPVPPVLVAALASLPVLLSAMVSGIDAASRKLSELAYMLGASRLGYYRDFLLPSLAPALAAASRSAVGVALRISGIAEAFGSSGGIGYMIVNYYNLAEPKGVFAWALLLVALMIAIDKLLLEPLEKRFSRWSVMM